MMKRTLFALCIFCSVLFATPLVTFFLGLFGLLYIDYSVFVFLAALATDLLYGMSAFTVFELTLPATTLTLVAFLVMLVLRERLRPLAE